MHAPPSKIPRSVPACYPYTVHCLTLVAKWSTEGKLSNAITQTMTIVKIDTSRARDFLHDTIQLRALLRLSSPGTLLTFGLRSSVIEEELEVSKTLVDDIPFLLSIQLDLAIEFWIQATKYVLVYHIKNWQSRFNVNVILRTRPLNEATRFRARLCWFYLLTYLILSWWCSKSL